MGEHECRRLLKLALDADEQGDKTNAVIYYTNAVEEIIKLGPGEARDKLNVFANKALDRAEELKGISHNQPPNIPISPNKSAFVKSSAPTNISPSTSSQHLKPALEVSGKQTYSIEELRVLEYTSHINNLTFVPFMDVDLKEKFHYPLPYSDKDGLLELSPKQKRSLETWARIGELSSDPKLVAGSNVDFYSIKQTVVSDCSFVASLAVASLYEKQFGKRLVSSIIYPRNAKDEPIYNPSGKYSIKLHVNGVPRKVVIDDFLPIGNYNQLLCSYSSNKNEFWVSLLEKAYMKLMGGYDFPGSNSNIDLHALTGWIPERIAIRPNDSDFNADAKFERLREGQSTGRCLITVATGDLSNAEADRTGLVATHAYAVLGLREVNGIKLFQLKNPWSHLRWRGNYSELDSVHWTKDLQEELNYDPSMAAQVDNGVFWIDYNSVLHFFDVFYLNWDPKLFQFTYCIHESWNAGVGPTKDAYTIGDNPQYALTVPAGRGSIWILLTRHITSIDDFRENKEYITLLAYNNSGKRVFYPCK